MRKKVLVLDANQRSALAATRSLGLKGIEVVAADETFKTLAGSSRFCKESFIYPSPYNDSEGFIDAVKEEAKKRSVGVLFPMTDITTHLVLKHREVFSDISVPFAPFEAFDLLTNKWRLFELASWLGIPMPKTYFINSPDQIAAVQDELTFPLVIKPFRSRIATPDGWLSASVRYAYSLKELHDLVKNIKYFNEHPFMLQEYINGRGQGVFALYDSGEPKFFFAHRRLREKPPSGGASVLCESIEVDPELGAISRRLLDHAGWHGIAMVEFKISNKGQPYLMEVNARFWGSLQLAIDAGADFPYQLYKMANGEKVDDSTVYRRGIRSRWLLGDLDNLYLNLKYGSFSRLHSIWEFLRPNNLHTKHEINRWSDLKPFLFELKHYLIQDKK